MAQFMASADLYHAFSVHAGLFISECLNNVSASVGYFGFYVYVRMSVTIHLCLLYMQSC